MRRDEIFELLMINLKKTKLQILKFLAPKDSHSVNAFKPQDRCSQDGTVKVWNT
jgi:hypothetical protein